MARSLLLSFLLSSCGALEWLQAPISGRECLCPSAPSAGGAGLSGSDGAPAADQRAPAPTRGSRIVDGLAAVGGAATGNPFAWSLVGQAANLILFRRPRSPRPGVLT